MNTIRRILKFKTLLENWTIVCNTFKSIFHHFLVRNGITATQESRCLYLANFGAVFRLIGQRIMSWGNWLSNDRSCRRREEKCKCEVRSTCPWRCIFQRGSVARLRYSTLGYSYTAVWRKKIWMRAWTCRPGCYSVTCNIAGHITWSAVCILYWPER